MIEKGSVSMTEFAPAERGFINLRGAAADERFAAAIEQVTGVALPVEPNTSTAGETPVRIYWLGPDEWLIGCERARPNAMVATLEDALAGQSVAVNDVSGGLVVAEIRGPDARELLARGCTLDLDPRAFKPDDCAQTMLAKANVLIAYIDDTPVYEIIVRRSFSEYLRRWLRQTRHSLAGSVSSS